jgi:hypothetical protein
MRMALAGLRRRFGISPLNAFDRARHSTRAMIRVQRSPKRKSRAMNPAFLFSDLSVVKSCRSRAAVQRHASSLTRRKI